MKEIRINLATNEVDVSDIFELESYATALLVDYSGTGVDDWDKFVDLQTGDGEKHQVALGAEVAPIVQISNLFTVKGTLIINPIAKMLDGDRTRVHAFKSFKFDVQETVNAYGDGSINKEDVIYPILRDIEELKATQLQDQIVHAEDVARLETKDKKQDETVAQLRKDHETQVEYLGSVERRVAKNEEDIEYLKGATVGEIGKHIEQIEKNKEDIVDIEAHDRYQDEKITELLEEANRKDLNHITSNIVTTMIDEDKKGKDTVLKLGESLSSNGGIKVVEGGESIQVEKEGAYIISYSFILSVYGDFPSKNEEGFIKLMINEKTVKGSEFYTPTTPKGFANQLISYNLKEGDKIKVVVNDNVRRVENIRFHGNISVIEQSSETPISVEYVPPAIIKDVTKNTKDVKQLQSIVLEQDIEELDKWDLNDYKSPGHFLAKNSTVIGKVVNKPLGLPSSGFSMEVFTNKIGGVHQILKSLSSETPNIYYRAFNSSKWTEWNRVANEEEVNKKADKTYVDSQDNKKADKTYVDKELNKKADIVESMPMKDYIIDFGENSNGKWEKYKSGKLVMWGITIASENNKDYTQATPLSFVGDRSPDVYDMTLQLTVNRSGGFNNVSVQGKGFTLDNKAFIYRVERESAVSSTPVHWRFVGKWK